MLNEDEKDFINLVSQFGDIIVDNKGNSLTMEEVIKSDKSVFYILSQHSKIIYSMNGFIDVICSDVIEFSRSMARNEKKVQYGRLWVEIKYFDESGTSVTKEKWLNERYSSYKKWIEKQYKISKCKDFYIGIATYNLYKHESSKLMATPVLEVEFE
jgi:hypothetical protein